MAKVVLSLSKRSAAGCGDDVADLDLALRDARQTARGEGGAARGCLDTFSELAVGGWRLPHGGMVVDVTS